MTGTDLHDLFDRAVEPLDLMPDAVPEVLVAGRRSVLRRRTIGAVGAIAGAAAGVAAVVGAINLTGTGAEPPAAGSGTSPTASAVAPPTHAPSSPNRNKDRTAASDPAVPPELVAFNRDVVAPALDRALPSRFGTVGVNGGVNGGVGEFVITGGKTYELQFFVSDRPEGYPREIFRCSAYTSPKPGEPDRFPSCTERTLPDGMRAVAITEDIDQTSGGLEALRALTIYRDKLVELSLYPSEEKPRQTPISRTEMLDALANADLADAYHQWATHPGWTN